MLFDSILTTLKTWTVCLCKRKLLDIFIADLHLEMIGEKEKMYEEYFHTMVTISRKAQSATIPCLYEISDYRYRRPSMTRTCIRLEFLSLI